MNSEQLEAMFGLTTITPDRLRGLLKAESERDKYLDALRRVYMWIQPAPLIRDEDTALTEARRIVREVLP